MKHSSGRRQLSVDTSIPLGRAQMSTPTEKPKISVETATNVPTRRASTPRTAPFSRAVYAQVSPPPRQKAKPRLPMIIKPRQAHIWEREATDHYVEPHWLSTRLFELEDFDRSQLMLDPCTGWGHIAEAAKAAVSSVSVPLTSLTGAIPAARSKTFSGARRCHPISASSAIHPFSWSGNLSATHSTLTSVRAQWSFRCPSQVPLGHGRHLST
jgi:hypothetical protein